VAGGDILLRLNTIKFWWLPREVHLLGPWDSLLAEGEREEALSSTLRSWRARWERRDADLAASCVSCVVVCRLCMSPEPVMMRRCTSFNSEGVAGISKGEDCLPARVSGCSGVVSRRKGRGAEMVEVPIPIWQGAWAKGDTVCGPECGPSLMHAGVVGKRGLLARSECLSCRGALSP